ncbi:MAG: hypothetical protein ACRCU5_13855 [Rhizobiaceae bacterium]
MTIKNASPARSMNAGEFSPDAMGRPDVKQYYSASKRMKGIEPVPQGGYQLMGGTRHKMKARRPLAGLPITGISTVTTALAPGTHTVWSGVVNGLVSVVHVVNFVATVGAATFQVEANTSNGWLPVGAVFGPWLTAADRTAAFAPQEGRTATALRIRATVTVNGTTINIGSVQAKSEVGIPAAPHHVPLTTDDNTHYVGLVTAGIVDFVTDDGYAGSALLPLTTEDMLPDIGDYAEADTIVLFHASSVPTQRIRNFGGRNEWGVDAWPYEDIPEIDLGGTYLKVNDKWEINITWSADTEFFLRLTVDGETIEDQALRDSVSNSVILISAGDNADWNALAAALQAQLIGLGTLGPGVVVTQVLLATSFRRFTVEFTGDLSGVEYQLSATISNTVIAAANSVHAQIGKTAGEPIFSATRGYPGIAEDVQSRMFYGRIPAATGAVLASKSGDAVDLNIEGQNDAAARLDRIRARTNETILAIKEAKYTVVLTDRAPYFITNRTIERNTPLNFVVTGDVGICPNTSALDLDGRIYYISSNGDQHISLTYDDVNAAYGANSENLLSNHLTVSMRRQVRQRAEDANGAGSIWITRQDGRLIKAQIIRNQDITGYCEWLASQRGFVHEVSVDGANRLWLTITRAGVMTHELYDRSTFLQGVVTKTCDFGGVVTDLSSFCGEVWAYASGNVLGPFTVDGGQINLGDFFHGDIDVGTWVAPVAETMPMPKIVGNDDIVFRPGRIHTAHLNLIETTSIAIAANDGLLQNYDLKEAFDPVNAPMPKKTRLISIYGLLGMAVGPTLTVSQLRPGWLRLRDLAVEARL